MQVECSICRDWKEKKSHKWFTPTTKQRRGYFFSDNHKVSHGYCLVCSALDLKAAGGTEADMKRLLKEAGG
jgi:hypothetical protein